MSFTYSRVVCIQYYASQLAIIVLLLARVGVYDKSRIGVVCVHRLHVNNVLSFCIGGGGSGRNQYILDSY